MVGNMKLIHIFRNKNEHMKNCGFTLIELLVVLSIIGILSAFVTANLLNVRQKARDGQRKSDVRQIQSALELYRADAGIYPDPNSNLNACGTGPSDVLKQTVSGNVIMYLSSIPCDPLGTSAYNSGIYYYYANNYQYTLVGCLENPNDTDNNDAASFTCGSGSCSSVPTGCNTKGPSSPWYYVVYNP